MNSTQEPFRPQRLPLQRLGRPRRDPSLLPPCPPSRPLGQVNNVIYILHFRNPTSRVRFLKQIQNLKPGALCLWFASSWLLSPVLPRPQPPKGPALKQHLLSSVLFSVYFGTQLYFFWKTFELLSNSPGKLFAAANFALVYIITAELFPTYIRTTAIGGTSLAMLFIIAFV